MALGSSPLSLLCAILEIKHLSPSGFPIACGHHSHHTDHTVSEKPHQRKGKKGKFFYFVVVVGLRCTRQPERHRREKNLWQAELLKTTTCFHLLSLSSMKSCFTVQKLTVESISTERLLCFLSLLPQILGISA